MSDRFRPGHLITPRFHGSVLAVRGAPVPLSHLRYGEVYVVLEVQGERLTVFDQRGTTGDVFEGDVESAERPS